MQVLPTVFHPTEMQLPQVFSALICFKDLITWGSFMITQTADHIPIVWWTSENWWSFVWKAYCPCDVQYSSRCSRANAVNWATSATILGRTFHRKKPIHLYDLVSSYSIGSCWDGACNTGRGVGINSAGSCMVVTLHCCLIRYLYQSYVHLAILQGFDSHEEVWRNHENLERDFKALKSLEIQGNLCKVREIFTKRYCFSPTCEIKMTSFTVQFVSNLSLYQGPYGFAVCGWELSVWLWCQREDHENGNWKSHGKVLNRLWRDDKDCFRVQATYILQCTV